MWNTQESRIWSLHSFNYVLNLIFIRRAPRGASSCISTKYFQPVLMLKVLGKEQCNEKQPLHELHPLRHVVPGTLCRKCHNKCEGHRSVPRNEQLSAPAVQKLPVVVLDGPRLLNIDAHPLTFPRGSSHQKSESANRQWRGVI